jgi:hypothetical protein
MHVSSWSHVRVASSSAISAGGLASVPSATRKREAYRAAPVSYRQDTRERDESN